ncbi:MAG: BON domain-containing protein [Candidatus Eremiobacteraeota bacterium]|nr:BON domain-containing protein [Candidatus Eremiobacteraeota bacterium]
MKRAVRSIFVALVALGGLAGCTQKDVQSAGNAIASAAPKLANDAFIVTAVEAKLFSIDADSALHVAVASHDGDVRLSGKVKDGNVLRRFVAEAKAVRGVRGVAAQLALDAHLPRTKDRVADFALAATVRARIAGQAGLNGLNLHVSASGGTVTLAGAVNTPQVRATIVDAARKTPGVKAVVDRIDVRG